MCWPVRATPPARSLALVKGSKIATSISSWYDGDGLDDRMVGLYSQPADGKSAAELEAAVDAELAKFLAEGPSEDEIARAKSVLVASAIYARDSQEGMANYYGEGLAEGLTVADLDAWADRIQAVTADQVKAVAAKYLTPARSVTRHFSEPEAAPAEPAPEANAMSLLSPVRPNPRRGIALLWPAAAMDIQSVRSPGGIEAWLVEEQACRSSRSGRFRRRRASPTAGRPRAGLRFDERGRGRLRSTAFAQRCGTRRIGFGGSADIDAFYLFDDAGRQQGGRLRTDAPRRRQPALRSERSTG